MVNNRLKRRVRAGIKIVIRLGMRWDRNGSSAQVVRCDLETVWKALVLVEKQVMREEY